MLKKVTWTLLFRFTILAALIQPFLLSAGLDASTRDSFDDMPHALFGYIDVETLRFFYLLYLGRLAVPALIYAVKQSNRTRGMLTHGLTYCFLLEIVIAIAALNQVVTNHANEGFEALGSLFFIAGLLLLSIVLQIVGMIVGAIRGFERVSKV